MHKVPDNNDYGHYSQLDPKGQALFAKAIMEQAIEDKVDVAMITSWSKERVEMYQMAFYLYNISREMRELALMEPESLVDQAFMSQMDEEQEDSEENDSDDKPFQYGI